MEVVTGSALLRSEVFPGVDVRGQEHLVIITQGTWSLPAPGQRARPIEPTPFAHADEHHGEPGLSALRRSHDMARFKPQCDILFDACAHAPDGKAVSALAVQARVGDWSKRIKVWGPRSWKRVLMSYEPSKPEPFVRMPLHLGLAFGGTRSYGQGGKQGSTQDQLAEAYAANPVGIGWAGQHTLGQASGQPMACLEDFEDPINRPDGQHRPIALSAIGANVPERQQYAGTYDEAWRKNVFPFLPEDFDERFFQSAPADQRIAYPKGGEEVELIHLLAGQPHLKFTLPALNTLQVRVLRKDYSIEVPTVQPDTLFFETEARRLSVVWRASVPIRRRIQEFNTIAVGPIDEQWWRARSLGLDESGCAGCGQPVERAA